MPIIDRDLETDRLILRPLSASDAQIFAHLANDWNVARYTAGIAHPYTLKMAEGFIAAQSYAPDTNSLVLAIGLKPTKGLIGCIGLYKIDPLKKAEIGYWLGYPYWGKGLATEAIKRAIDFAFSDLKLDSLEASVVRENIASIHILEKFGFAEIGERENPASARGGSVRVVVFELLKE